MSSETGPAFHACHEATSDSVKLHRLRKLISKLASQEKVENELISLYIPHKISIDGVIANLKSRNDLENLKSENSKVQLKHNIENLIQLLKQQKEIPENGMAFFALTTSVDYLQARDLGVEEIVPPKPIMTYFCVVNHHFHLEPLREMLRDQKIVGIISLDSKDAALGILDGEQLTIMKSLTSGIPGKSGKGGQSQRRYEREREMELTHYFHRIAEHAAEAFLGNPKVTVLMVCGPGPTKGDFVRGSFLQYELRNVLLNAVDTQLCGAEAIREAIKKSSETLKNLCASDESRIMQRFFTELGKQDGLVTYGLQAVLDALRKGEVDTILATDNSEVTEIVAICKKCGFPKRKLVVKASFQLKNEFVSGPCEICGSVEFNLEEKDVIDILEDTASQTDAKVEVISSPSEEKNRLTKLGGFAAILRYKSK